MSRGKLIWKVNHRLHHQWLDVEIVWIPWRITRAHVVHVATGFAVITTAIDAVLTHTTNPQRILNRVEARRRHRARRRAWRARLAERARLARPNRHAWRLERVEPEEPEWFMLF
jgi:hypothetical protein